MKLIFLNRYFHPDISATSQILTDLAFDLAREGSEIHVITSRQLYGDPTAVLPSAVEVDGVRIHRVWTTRFGRSNLLGRAVDYATFYLSAGIKLFGIARTGDVIVAKTDPPLISVVAAWASRRRGATLVNWLQDVFPEVAEVLGIKVLRGYAGRLARRLRDYSLRTARTNVVLGERMAATVVAKVPGASVTVIHNWSDGSQVRSVPQADNPLRSQWGLQGRFVVGYSGNMGRAHEFDTILAACASLRDEAAIVFLFIGAGRQRQWIEDEARRRSLANVMFQPYQPREMLANSLSVADVHLVTLQPALEGLIVPSKFYGIAAAGRPTLFVGDVGGEIGSLVVRHGCGIAIATGDSKGLASAILGLYQDRGASAQMGVRAREVFEMEFDQPVALARWRRVLGIDPLPGPLPREREKG